MYVESKFAKAAFVVAGLSLVLGLSQPGFAQTVSGIASVAGGSSALLGDFRVASFHEGAIPQTIGALSSAVTNYKSASQSDNAIVCTNVHVAVAGVSGGETITDAEIRYNASNTSSIKIIILLRSDSGNGIRYVANGAQISSWGTFTNTDGSAITDANATAVVNYLTLNAGTSVETVDTGLSDVTAHTVYAYANFANLATGLTVGTTVSKYELPVQVLLPIYNAPSGGFPSGTPLDGSILNLATSNWQDLVNNTSLFGLTNLNRRESTSGTRMTELLNVQSSVAESATIQSGTGAMLNAVNNNSASFGYAFVGGTNGNNRANTRVAERDGYWPTSLRDSNSTISLANNNGQPSYSSVATSDPLSNGGCYWDGVLSGDWTAWSYANAYSLIGSSGSAVFSSVQTALNNNPTIVHSEGLVSADDLDFAGVVRESTYATDTAEYTTDGNPVTH